MSIDLKKVADNISWYGAQIWKCDIMIFPAAIHIAWTLFTLVAIMIGWLSGPSDGVIEFKTYGAFMCVDANVILGMVLVSLMSTSFLSTAWQGGYEYRYDRDIHATILKRNTYQRNLKFSVILISCIINIVFWFNFYNFLGQIIEELGIDKSIAAKSADNVYLRATTIGKYARIYADTHGIKNICLKTTNNISIFGECDELRKQPSASAVELEQIARGVK